VAPEDKFDRLQQLVEKGEEKGYVAYEELGEALPADLGNGTELGNLLAGLDGSGIELLDDPKLEFDQKLGDAEDLLDLELGPVVAEKINDPVRTYLREMGTVPLLSREGETEIARRIERGQNTVMKALSRSPLVIQ
jgi:RNA polymerase primary sigma factor